MNYVQNSGTTGTANVLPADKGTKHWWLTGLQLGHKPRAPVLERPVEVAFKAEESG